MKGARAAFCWARSGSSTVNRVPADTPAGQAARVPARAGHLNSGNPCREQGFYGWRLLFFLWVVYTIPIGFAYYSPAVLYPFMIREFGWSRGETMAGATALMLTFGLASPLTALMIARIGARATIVAGAVLLALASSLTAAFGHLYALFLVLSVAVGLGASLASMIPVQTVVMTWFNTRRAMALGLVLGGGAIGGFVAPQIIDRAAAAANDSWQVGWIVVASASAVAGLVALATIRNRPEDMGQHPDGFGPQAEGPSGQPALRTTGTYRTTRVWTVREALRTRSLWLLVVASGGCFFLWQLVVTQGPLHLQDRGFDTSKAAFFYSLAIGLSIVGRFTIALLGDRIEPRRLFAGGTLCVLAGGVLFWFVSPSGRWAAYLYPLLTGFGFGVAYVCIPTLVGNYWGAASFAGLSGVLSPVTMLIQTSAAPLAGFVYDLQGSYLPALIIAWGGAAVGFIAILFCKPP